MDAQGIALLLTAISATAGSGVTIYIQLQTFNRLVKSSAERDAKLNTIHNLVNGQSELLEAAAMARGKLEGVQQERDHPMEPRR